MTCKFLTCCVANIGLGACIVLIILVPGCRLLVSNDTGGAGCLVVIWATLLGGIGCVGNCTNLAVVVPLGVNGVGCVGNLAIKVELGKAD